MVAFQATPGEGTIKCFLVFGNRRNRLSGGQILKLLVRQYLGAARSQSIVSTAPLFAVVLAVVFLGERPNWLVVLGTVIIVLAMAFILGEPRGTSVAEARSHRRVLWGALLGLIAAAGVGSSTVVAKEVVTEYATPLMAGAFALLMGSFAMLAVREGT